MKTILMIIGGMADVPDEELGWGTPLTAADVHSIHVLGEGGHCGVLESLPAGVEDTVGNAVSTLLGYDLSRGMATKQELTRYGESTSFADAPEGMGFNIIPGFSGHGAVVSASRLIRGVGKMSLLDPIDVCRPESTWTEQLDYIAETTIAEISRHEFVMVYVDSMNPHPIPGDYGSKVEALEEIDRNLVTPVADFVWCSEEFINLVLVSDRVVSWRTGKSEKGIIPVIIYFNDNMVYAKGEFNELYASHGDLKFKDRADLMRFLVTFDPADTPWNLPDEASE